MQKRDDAMPESNRSPSEIAFVLRHAKRKAGPAVLRDMAREGGETAAAAAVKPQSAKPHKTKTLF